MFPGSTVGFGLGVGKLGTSGGRREDVREGGGGLERGVSSEACPVEAWHDVR